MPHRQARREARAAAVRSRLPNPAAVVASEHGPMHDKQLSVPLPILNKLQSTRVSPHSLCFSSGMRVELLATQCPLQDCRIEQTQM